MNLQIDIQSESAEPVPDEDDIRRWIVAALDGQRTEDTEISLRIVDEDEMASLNHTWRAKSGSTNVLSFPANDGLPRQEVPLLGDIAISIETANREAALESKPFENHFMHLVIHGFLHLFGYDHETEEEADEMESLEIRILAELGIANPYLD